MQKRKLTIGLALVGLAVVAGGAAKAMDDMAVAAEQQAGQVPLFEVDPFWPKPLPQHWLVGPMIGITTDANDGVWIVHRSTLNQFVLGTEVGAVTDTSYYNNNAPARPPVSECCQPGPPIMHFDADGNLLHAWGGPGTETGNYRWPESNHGVTIDGQGNVWIGGNGGNDRHILKFAEDGRFLAQYGTPGAEPSSTSDVNFNQVARLWYVAEGNEIFVADGYGNRRVAVLDAANGRMKRMWGAKGNRPDDAAAEALPAYRPGETPPNQFRTPVHCANRSNDGMIYVCDRPSNRLSVFRTDGTFVRETIIAPQTLSQGSTWDVAFSPDQAQQFMYMADGQNMKVYVMNRQSLEVLYSFGDGGRQPGLFFAPHSIATDSQGNIFTTETYEGSRLQKFRFTGMGARPRDQNMGAAWPQNRRSGAYGWEFDGN